jgi:hypothetical protein
MIPNEGKLRFNMMKLSKELQEKLSAAETDVQACKILAQNGVDPE